jgi:ABC-type antimicrobial peptide transport system, ATPase component
MSDASNEWNMNMHISDPSLVASGLTKSIGDRTLWSDICFKLDPGSLTAITGPSGSGKTSLINVLGCLDKPDNGCLDYGGQSWLQLPPRHIRRLYREKISFLFQNYALIDQWNVEANLMLALRSLGIPRRQRKMLVEESLEAVGLQGREDALVYTLSGGEQQRLAIARVIAHRPPVVLADEPTAALDFGNAEIVMAHLRRLSREGSIVVVTTHSPDVSSEADQRIDLTPH